MSDPDQEEIRRKRLARLGGAPTTSQPQDASSQDLKSLPIDEASDNIKDCSTDQKSDDAVLQQCQSVRVIGSPVAGTPSATTEDVNMQAIDDSKELIKHETKDGKCIDQSGIVGESAETSTVHRSESSTAMDVTFTPSSSPPKPLASGKTNTQLESASGQANNSSTSQKSQSPILTDFDSGIETMDIDNDPSAQAGSGSNPSNYQQVAIASNDVELAQEPSSNLNTESIHAESNNFSPNTCPMERDEQSQENVGSKFNPVENMQELPSKNSPEKRKRTSSSATYDISENQVLEILQKIFGCKIFKTEDQESNSTKTEILYLPECSKLITERKEDVLTKLNTVPVPKEQSLDYSEIVSEILTEVLTGMTKNIYPPKVKTVGQTHAYNTKEDMFRYLVECYEDVGKEERNNKKKLSLSSLSNAFAASRNGIIMYTCLVCSGTFETEIQGSATVTSTPIFEPLLKQKLPSGFLIDIINYATMEFGNGGKEIFEPLLRCLISEARSSNIVELGNYRKAVSALCELSDISMEKNRPICQLMTEMPEWLPEEISTGSGNKNLVISMY